MLDASLQHPVGLFRQAEGELHHEAVLVVAGFAVFGFVFRFLGGDRRAGADGEGRHQPVVPREPDPARHQIGVGRCERLGAEMERGADFPFEAHCIAERAELARVRDGDQPDIAGREIAGEENRRQLGVGDDAGHRR